MNTGAPTSVRNMNRDRWNEVYSKMPVRRMIALYDYDPQELSPNVDADVCVCHYNSQPNY